MANPAYCAPAGITKVCGQLGVDLRTDDVPDLGAHLDAAVQWASDQIDWYCSRYAQSDLAANTWVTGQAEFLAVYWLCLHRLNDVPKSIENLWLKFIEPKLLAIQQGKATVPRCAASRRPITVTSPVVDNRRFNDQVRVDTTRSTGVAQGYNRPTDPTAPDER